MSKSRSETALHRLTEADQQQLTTILYQLPSTWQEGLLNTLTQVDSRLLPALLPLLGPTLRNLHPEGGVLLLERIAQLAQVFPAGLLELFRTLRQVYDEVGIERTLKWIAVGEEIASRNPQAGEAFFALKSRTSLLALHGASPAAVLTDIQGILVKFLHMLSGTASALAEANGLSLPPPLAEEKGELVPLPSSIEMFPTYEENFRLYRVLTAHQAGRVEFGTYACSLSDLWPSLPPLVHTLLNAEADPPDDLASYFRLFPRPDLIEDLFLCVEGKRIAARLASTYRGLRADLDWAESLGHLLSPGSSVLLSYLSDSVWTDLGSTGNVSDSLRLATEIYLEFLQAELGPTSESSALPQQERLVDVAEESIAFLTGLEGEGRRGSPALSMAESAPRQRRAQVTPGIHYRYDEWDYEIEDYRAHWCQLREIPLLGDDGAFFAYTLTTYADMAPDIKREFERLRPRMYRQVKGLEEGEEIDLDAVVTARVDRLTGISPSPKLYIAREPLERDVAVLLLLDLSASTAARLPTEVSAQTPLGGRRTLRVIDVLKEAVVLLSTALEEIGDAYAIYGFSSHSRHDVKVYPAKTFSESLSSEVKGRIGALAPQGSTRMGTAVRHATRKLKDLTSRAKMLLLLSDGYPEDEGYGKPIVPPTYGLRDTMMAFREAERNGIVSFCLTVDKGGHDYLREMCAPRRYMVIEDILSLPTELPKIYQRHIWSQWF